MHLSIQQAATLLGKTRRQVIYLIEQQRLAARKEGGRWVIEKDDLALDTHAEQRATHNRARLQETIEEALLKPRDKVRYSLASLKAVQITLPMYRQVCELGATYQDVAGKLRECLGRRPAR